MDKRRISVLMARALRFMNSSGGTATLLAVVSCCMSGPVWAAGEMAEGISGWAIFAITAMVMVSGLYLQSIKRRTN